MVAFTLQVSGVKTPVNYRSMCVWNSTLSSICNHSNILLSCRGNTIFIDFNYTTANRWAALCLCSGGCLQCCHVLIFKCFSACFLVLSHKDMHFIKLIKCSVVDNEIYDFFGVIKQSIFSF